MSKIIASPEHYFGDEMNIGFSETTLGDMLIKQREREGSIYNSFSHRLKIAIAPEDGIANVGDEILVQHFVEDQRPMVDREYLVAHIEQIYAIKKRFDFEQTDNRYLENFDAVDGFLAYPHEIITDDGFEHYENAQDMCEENYAVTFCGKEIEYTKNGDYEFFHNDIRVHYIMKSKCYLIDDEVNEDVFKEVWKDGDEYVNEDGGVLLIYNAKVFVSKKGRYFSLKSEIGGVIYG